MSYTPTNNRVVHCRLYVVPSSTMKKPFTTAYLQKVLNKSLKWSSFEEYRLFSSNVWMITVNSLDLSGSCCTCPPFLKRGQCKHVLGMHIRLKLITVPPAATDVPLGQKRKRGRPKKASRALIRD